MYTFFKNFRKLNALIIELPGFILALIVAEAFYKFHSFTLECAAFLPTWYAISFVFSQTANRLRVTQKATISKAIE